MVYLPGGSPANRWFPRGSLLDGAHHDLNEAGLLPVIKRLLHGAGFLQQQVSHALPVLHHVVALNQRVHQVCTMFMQLWRTGW